MTDGTISEYCLERYVLRELPAEEAEEVERAAAADPRVRAALEAIAASDRDILSLYPPSSIKAALLARLENAEGSAPGRLMRRIFPGGSLPSRRTIALLSSAAALVLAAVLTLPRIKTLMDAGSFVPDVERTVVKGDSAAVAAETRLLIYRRRGGLAEVVSDGSEAAPGALLQIGYVAAAEAYGLILSIDGRGGVTRHFPVEEGGSTLLARDKRSILPNAIELDDAPEFERFFLVTSETPIDVPAVLGKAAELGSDPARARRSALDLPAGLRQSSVLVLKGGSSR